MRQFGGVCVLASVGTAVLPDVPEPDPDPNDAANVAAVRYGNSGRCLHRPRDRSCRCHVHRRYGYAYDWLRGRPVRRDRPESTVLGVLLPLSVSGRARRGLYVCGWYDVRLQGVAPA